MAQKPEPHPVLSTRRLRLRQFRAEDADAMHECFAHAEAMRFWNHPVHTREIETERAVRRFIDCTPSYYRVWAVADAATDLCLGLVNFMTATSAVSSWPSVTLSIPPTTGRA